MTKSTQHFITVEAKLFVYFLKVNFYIIYNK